jgi:SPP1 family predicted phage head-tail adaptor
MDTRIGRLRYRVDVQRSIEDTDPVTGEAVRTWLTFVENLPAAFRENQTEQEQARKLVVKSAGQFIVRFRTDINAGCRLLLDGRKFDVVSAVDPDDGRRRWLAITATETR